MAEEDQESASALVGQEKDSFADFDARRSDNSDRTALKSERPVGSCGAAVDRRRATVRYGDRSSEIGDRLCSRDRRSFLPDKRFAHPRRRSFAPKERYAEKTEMPVGMDKRSVDRRCPSAKHGERPTGQDERPSNKSKRPFGHGDRSAGKSRRSAGKDRRFVVHDGRSSWDA